MSQGTYAMNKPTFGYAADLNPFGVVFYVSNTTNPTEDQGSPGTTARGRGPKNPFTTIQAANDAAVSGRGDTIVIQGGTYSENVSFTRAGLRVRAADTMGYPDRVIISGDCYVTGSNMVFEGIEFFSNSTLAASMSVGLARNSSKSEVNSVWFTRCSFASDGTTEPPFGLRIFGGNNHGVIQCRFVDNTRALALLPGSTSRISGVQIRECDFLENTTYDIGNTGGGAASGVWADDAAQYAVHNVTIVKNDLNRGEVTVTRHIDIQDSIGTSSGMMAHNRIANATNSSGQIRLPATIRYVANMTEAGVSTAAPV